MHAMKNLYLVTMHLTVFLTAFNSAGGEARIVEEIEVDYVWAANTVSFDLYTAGEKQFVAYYDENRMMTVAAREIGSDQWKKTTLPNKLVWDSHNSVAIAADEHGYLHVSGNMHVNPLTYFRSEKPFDIHSFVEVNKMVGTNEASVTYPRFFTHNDGSLLFRYRSGTCGNGNVLVNRFLPEEGKWERYLKKPLFEGINENDVRAAYHRFTRDSDGNYHFVWIWRWNPRVDTTHQICYAKTSDLINWTNAAGEPVQLPFRPDDERVIVDPTPAKGGMHNGRYEIILDQDGSPIIGYIKYDDEGLTQFYLARFEEGEWVSTQISDWDFRWEFFGGGDQMTVGGAFSFAGLSEEGFVVIDWRTEKGDSGRYAVDSKTFEHADESVNFTEKYPSDMRSRMTDRPGLNVNIAMDQGRPSDTETRYVLKWEGGPRSHGRHAPEVIPEGPLSKLVLLKVR